MFMGWVNWLIKGVQNHISGSEVAKNGDSTALFLKTSLKLPFLYNLFFLKNISARTVLLRAGHLVILRYVPWESVY